MSEKRVQSMHFGGPLGLAGLALLVSAAGIIVFDTSGASGPDVPPATVTEEPGTDPAVPIKTPTDTPRDPGIEVPVGDPDAGTTSTDPVNDPVDPVKPTKPETTSDKPTIVVPKPPVVSPPVKPAAQKRAEATFIVRIKGEPEIETAAKLFKKDPGGAEAAFAKYQSETPAFKGFRLVGASYSGELKLAYEFDAGVEPTRAEVRRVQDKIMGVKGVAYADPDYIAHPGKGN